MRYFFNKKSNRPLRGHLETPEEEGKLEPEATNAAATEHLPPPPTKPPKPKAAHSNAPSNSMINTDCSICMESFAASGDHEAKICPCGHTFCKSCLIGLPNPKKCPVCRERITARIDDLPRNYALIDILLSLPSAPPVTSAVAVGSDRKKTTEELRMELAIREAEERELKLAIYKVEMSKVEETKANSMNRLRNIEQEISRLNETAKITKLEIKNCEIKLNQLRAAIGESNYNQEPIFDEKTCPVCGVKCGSLSDMERHFDKRHNDRPKTAPSPNLRKGLLKKR